MARRPRSAASAFDSLAIEGALIAPAMLSKIAASEADGQDDANYRIPKGLTLRDEIARYFRMGQAQFRDFAKLPSPSMAATKSFVETLLRDIFAFPEFSPAPPHERGGRMLAVTSHALSGRAPLVVTRPSIDLDQAAPELSIEGRRRSPALALQDWLNASDEALWGFCCNGERLRLMRENASLTRPTYIEADLQRIFEADGFADFAALWLLVHASRFGTPGAPITDCALERWREAAGKEGIAARDRLRKGVEDALLVLGQGFLTETPELRERVVKGELPLIDYFGQLLRLIYRLIFLAVAEERDLLFAPNAPANARRLYADGYSFAALRAQAIRRSAWDRHFDKWQGLQVVFLALAHGEKRLGLPALGGLFLPELTLDLDAARLPNRALMEAIYKLAWLKDGAALTRINWRDMETQELGSVYEGLLELTPRVADDGRTFLFAEGGEAQGHARKTSGSYYTPDSLVQALLDTALDPVLDRAEGESENPVEALLALRVIDPACGSGHFLLAAARRIASRVARLRGGGVAAAGDYRHALRDVARQCLHGVDRNLMAVELTKVALWIETIESGKPLGFLDANIRCGDALLGVLDLEALRQGIPDEAYKPLTGDDKETTKHFAARNRAEKAGQGALDFGGGSRNSRLPAPPPLADAARALRALPEDSVEEITEKQRRIRAAESDPGRWRWRVAADLYVAAFLAPKTGGVPINRNIVTIPTTAHVWAELSGQQVYGPLIGRGQDLAGEARAFHWPLDFPEAFAAGGFDVVLGNPPWERAKLQDTEFFPSRDPEIANASTAAKRKILIAKLEKASDGTFAKKLWNEYQLAKRIAELSVVFFRTSGRYPYSARGDINTYALFTELAFVMLRPHGAAGLIVPSGIAMESATSDLFGYLSSSKSIRAFYDFENRSGFFHGLHTKHKFAAFSLAKENIERIELCFFATAPSDLKDPRKKIELSSEDILNFNPNTKTLPILRAVDDLQMLRKIYRKGDVLVRGTGNLWNVNFLRMFDMTLDSNLFFDSINNERLPLYEAKMFWLFDHRWADLNSSTDNKLSVDEKNDVKREPTPRFYVNTEEVEARLFSRGWNEDWILAYRNVSDFRNERTFVCSVIPKCAVGNSATLVLGTDKFVDEAYIFLSMANSMVFDYAARQKVPAMNVNAFMVEQFPFLRPNIFSFSEKHLVRSRVIELVFTSMSMRPFAKRFGYSGPPFAWNEDRRALLRSELDAFYARAYGLTRDELRYILDPADVRGPDYPSETFRVLKTNEIARYGEYRTARLVLDAWDRLERGEIDAAKSPTGTPVAQSTSLIMRATVDLDSLQDGAWSYFGTYQRGDAGAALAAVLKVRDGPTPTRDIRLMIAFVLEPRLLTPFLSEDTAKQWRRLVGQEAEPGVFNLAAFRALLDSNWGAAVRNHRGNGRLVESLGDNTWAPGQGLDTIETSGWPDGRAWFVNDALKGIDLTSGTTTLPSEVEGWIDNAAAA